MQTKKEIIKTLAISLWAIVSYHVMAIAFFLFGSLVWTDELLNEHYFMADTWMCVVFLLIFSYWLRRVYRKEPLMEPDQESVRMVCSKLHVLVLGLGGISALWLMFAGMIMENISFLSNSMERFDETWSLIDKESYFWVFMSVVLLGPIVEELLFRGLVFHYLERIKTGWFPIVLSGVAFGVWHGELVQVVYAALIGIALGIVYAKTHSLKVTIIIHVLNNFLSTLPPALNTGLVQTVILCASLAMIVPAIIILVRMSPKPQKKQEVYPV